MIDDLYNLTVQKMPEIVSPQWTDIRDQDALAHMRRLREAADARPLQMQNEPVPIDPLVQAHTRIAELEAEVKRLAAELEAERAQSPVSPHLKRIERRA